MWSKGYTKVFHNITKEQIWRVWQDVNNWPTWDKDAESCKLMGPFATGSTFLFKPKGFKAILIKLIDVKPLSTYTDCTRFFGATMLGTHEMVDVENGLKLTTTLTLNGPLSLFWRLVVANGIIATLPEQMELLVAEARKQVR